MCLYVLVVATVVVQVVELVRVQRCTGWNILAQGPQHATFNVRHVRLCCIMCFTRDLEEIIILLGFSLKYALCMSCIY